jgi:hypothetical protein
MGWRGICTVLFKERQKWESRVEGRYPEVERDKEGITCPLCNREEGAVDILPKCSETRRLRERLLNRKWQTINEEISYKKIINCTKTVQIRNLGSYLYKIKFKWENRIEELQLDDE